MRERAYLLGPNESMLGILSEPDDAPPAERPVMVLLNAGIVHRIGPHRKTVKLARALCDAGFRTLRFDLSGIGDSAARRDALTFAAGALADISEVFDDLEKRIGATSFVLMGLCSGADNSFYAALGDERVAGAILLDGIAYRTPRYYVELYRDKVTQASSWIRLGKRAARMAQSQLRRVLDKDAGGVEEDASSHSSAAVPDYVREFEPRDVVAGKLQQLCDRGVKMFWVYTDGTRLYHNYENQFFDMFKDVDFKGMVDHKYFADSNHTFTEVVSQQALVDAVTAWASSKF